MDTILDVKPNIPDELADALHLHGIGTTILILGIIGVIGSVTHGHWGNADKWGDVATTTGFYSSLLTLCGLILLVLS